MVAYLRQTLSKFDGLVKYVEKANVNYKCKTEFILLLKLFLFFPPRLRFLSSETDDFFDSTHNDETEDMTDGETRQSRNGRGQGVCVHCNSSDANRNKSVYFKPGINSKSDLNTQDSLKQDNVKNCDKQDNVKNCDADEKTVNVALYRNKMPNINVIVESDKSGGSLENAKSITIQENAEVMVLDDLQKSAACNVDSCDRNDPSRDIRNPVGAHVRRAVQEDVVGAPRDSGYIDEESGVDIGAPEEDGYSPEAETVGVLESASSWEQSRKDASCFEKEKVSHDVQDGSQSDVRAGACKIDDVREILPPPENEMCVRSGENLDIPLPESSGTILMPTDDNCIKLSDGLVVSCEKVNNSAVAEGMVDGGVNYVPENSASPKESSQKGSVNCDNIPNDSNSGPYRPNCLNVQSNDLENPESSLDSEAYLCECHKNKLPSFSQGRADRNNLLAAPKGSTGKLFVLEYILFYSLVTNELGLFH